MGEAQNMAVEMGGLRESHREGLMVLKTAFMAFVILRRDMDLEFCPPTSVISAVTSMAPNRACAQE